MRHKENHKQPQELKCSMCIYTNKNEAQLNKHKESHKDEELVECDMCNFAEEDPQGKSQGEIRTKVSDVWHYLTKLVTGRQPH